MIVPAGNDKQNTELVRKIAAMAKKKIKGPSAKAIESFIKRYYANVPASDLVGRSPETLLAMAHQHWKLIEKRPRSTSQVRVYNPDLKKDGWQSDHSVIEIANDDMPFLVDSVTSVIGRRGLTTHLIIHPLIKVRRNKAGKLQDLLKAGEIDIGAQAESVIHVEITHQSGIHLKELENEIRGVLDHVRAAVEDWRPMREQMSALISDLLGSIKGAPIEDVDEVREFMRWIHDNHFTFLGFREYQLTGAGKKYSLDINPKTGMGLLRDPNYAVFSDGTARLGQSAEIRAFAESSSILLVTKSNQRSTIHRPVHMDALAIKVRDASGKLIGIRIFVGLFTSSAYNRSPRDIPLLRRQVQQTMERSGFQPGSHDGKALMNILETYPRDELFQVSNEELLTTSIGIMNLQERRKTALFVRRDTFGRFVSCLVYVPRDRYNTDLRAKIETILCDSFEGHISAYYTALGESALGRLHFIVKTSTGVIPKVNIAKVEEQIIHVAQSWSDHLQVELDRKFGEEISFDIIRAYGNAFGPAYREQFDAVEAVGDIEIIREVQLSGDIGMNLYRADGQSRHQVRFKIYHPGMPVSLSDVLPLFEHMGFKVIDEIPHEVKTGNQETDLCIIQDFGLETRGGKPLALDKVRDIFQDAFLRVWRGEMESDRYNALVCGSQLDWQKVVILRAFSKYLRQAGVTFSQSYMADTLVSNGTIARDIVATFMAMFDPAGQQSRDKELAKIAKRIKSAFGNVVSADEDRILRCFINLVESLLRTNFYQQTDQCQMKNYLSFKIDSHKIEDLPLPKPFREIFVYSPRVEGIHLRFGKVARGGLRWSDRPEDFRTEVLGLVKAQQVKNAVIVPVGSKGGFVVKQPIEGGSRDDFLNEGIACYKIFMAGLLDITDNIKGPKITAPNDVVRRDEDDPYLVVAADKGTATFSDIANGISIDYGHWLGDAFASGGSQGYDHKKMGITARGGWESVKRHFREMGTNIQTEDFSVVGVGDMSGDVFGNGMLLSDHICLIAAFNHMHIFVDPSPDSAKSIVERRRLFILPRSGWSDYNTKLLSKGGAIFERSAKSLTLSAEIRARFGISKNKVTPNELLSHILRAECDLLWFGGIGTYVKASSQSNLDAGDRANDPIRLNGNDLNCKVVGEGANLGMTQLSRIEFAAKGGRLNTDSIDNSAGVDSSDHEVNIKILLNAVMEKGKLKMTQRNKLLASMTDEVGGLVLNHNYDQPLAITMIQSKGVAALDNQKRLMRDFERRGNLNRAVEFLPDEEVLAERALARQGLYRPEIAVLISYSKIWLYDQILASDLPDDPDLTDDLIEYFPTPLRGKYAKEILSHRLRREIIANRVINSLINRVGDTFIHEYMEKTGASPALITRAYMIVRKAFGLREIWGQIVELDNKVSVAVQTEMYQEIHRLIDRATLWFLRNGKEGLAVGAHVDEFVTGITEMVGSLSKQLPAHYARDLIKRSKPYRDAGVPEALAMRIASLVNLYSACDIVRVAGGRKQHSVSEVGGIYFAVGTRFRLGRLRAATERQDSDTYWGQLAIAAQLEEIYSHQLSLANLVIDQVPANLSGAKAVEHWVSKNGALIAPTEQLLNELWAADVNDLSMIAVASRQLRAMIDQGSR